MHACSSIVLYVNTAQKGTRTSDRVSPYAWLGCPKVTLHMVVCLVNWL
jgi:hypothetical protein